MWGHHHRPFGIGHATCSDETWFAVRLVLAQTYIIISRESLFDLSVQVHHVLELIENVFVRLLQPTLAQRKV